jgi:hypothetical protein
MEALLLGLLGDLERRCSILERILAALPEDVDTAEHALECYEILELARRDARDLRLDPALADPRLLRNYLGLFQRLAERVRLIEWMVVPFLVRFDEGDRLLTLLVRRIVMQTGLPVRRALVAGFSTQYYWTFPEYSVIAVPAGEAESLLGLADLCHELGHMLMNTHETSLLGTFPAILAAHVTNEEARMISEQRPPRYIADYLAHFRHWDEDWILEFACDMVGTYLAGPAFGFQHVRLCAGWAENAYYPTLGQAAEHPADFARLEGIVAVIEMLNDPADAEAVREMWSRYTSVQGDVEPADYATCYPMALIRELAQVVVAGCRTLSIKSYQEAAATDIIRVMIDAWDHFRADPDGHGAYEDAALRELIDELSSRR